jgi:hypothetical protein
MPEIESNLIITEERPVRHESLYVSEDFRRRIIAIKDRSLVADLLYRLFDEVSDIIADHKANMNLLGVSMDDPTKISYLTYDRICAAREKREHDRVWQDKDYRYHSGAGKVVRKLFSTLFVDLMNPSNPSRLSHLVARFMSVHNRPTPTEVIKDLTQLFTEVDFDTFNNAFRVEGFRQGDAGEVIYVRGHWIAELYNEKNYASLSGTLGNSCMRYERTTKYLDIYVKNPSVCRLAVLLNKEGKLQGRALVWTVEGKDYYDRIYYTSDLIQDRMKAFFLTEGIETCFPGYPEFHLIKVDEDTNNPDFNQRVILSHDYYPYMDSLKFMCTTKGLITNNENLVDSNDHLILNDTGGQFEHVSPNTIECACCEREVDEDDSFYIDTRGDDNRNENLCPDCGVYSEFHSGNITRENATYLNSIDSWVLSEYVTRDYSDEYILERDAVELFNGEYADRDDPNLREYASGEYFIMDEHDYVEYNNSYYKEDECTETKDGRTVPKQFTTEHEGEIWLTSDLDRQLNLNLI